MEAPEGILEAALEYAARGWSVLPLCPPSHLGVGKKHRGCGSPGKRPFFPDREGGSGEWKEFQSRPATIEEINRWWESNKYLNVGVALGPVSAMVGIDVDDEEGDDLLSELANGDLPNTWEYTTGKGRRLLYGLPEGVTVTNQAFKRPGTEIEILRIMSRGGQVVLPPSVHPNESIYRWRFGKSPDEIPLAPAPEWMRSPVARENEHIVRPAEGELITEGGRNNYLTSLAGTMRKHGSDEETILAALLSTNERRLDPPLSDAEIKSIARSMCRYEPDAFSGVTIKQGEKNAFPAPPVDPAGYVRKFRWASELTAPPQANDWMWEGYLPRAGITLLSALWKAGKTTLLAHLLKALGTSGTFLGKPIKASKVLYVSEEGEMHWVRRRDSLGIGDNSGFYLQPFASKPHIADWISFLGGLRDDIITHGFDLVVFDTLAKLWPVVEENDAGSVDASLMPLWELTKAGAGVLLIHHLRKSGGAEYTASRGSGALSAFPDILVELTRFDVGDTKSKKRVLKAKGRYEETPDELVIELVDGAYIHIPDPDQGGIGPDGKMRTPEPASEEEKVLAVLRMNPTPWMQVDEIRDALKERGWGLRYKDLNSVLYSFFETGQVCIKGKLRSKTDPRCYAIKGRDDLVPPLGVNGNEILEPDEPISFQDVVPGDTQGRNETD
jgi:hypothetical protein